MTTRRGGTVNEVARLFTSDLHLDHENIIRYCGRPYRNADDMALDLAARWASVVTASDTVYVLGDLVMKAHGAALALVAELPGRTILIRGNHDRGAATRYREVGGFAEVHPGLDLRLSDGTAIELSHYPFADERPDSDQRYRDRRPVDRGQWLACGHIHEKWRQLGRQVNVGIDAWGGRLVREDDLIALIAAGPGRRGRLAWSEAAVTTTEDALSPGEAIVVGEGNRRATSAAR